MKYKIKNKGNIPGKFRDRNGKMWTVGGNEYVITDSLPQDGDWDITELHKQIIPGKIIPTKIDEFEELVKLKDVEDEIARALLESYGNIENIRNSKQEDLEKISGIGKIRAKSILEQLRLEQ